MTDPVLTAAQVARLRETAGRPEPPGDLSWSELCDSHEALRARVTELERESEALRPVVEAALVLVEEWPLRATPNGGEIGLAVAVRAYRAALASLPSSSTPSEEGPTP